MIGARLVPMRLYIQVIDAFVRAKPTLNEYWEHLVDAHKFLASSEAPTASKEVFEIFVAGKLKRAGELQKMGVIAPRCLDLKTGKVYQ